MGDIIAHFGVEVDDRCWGQTSTNAKKFIQFMNRNDMILADVKSSGQGPVYTFQDSRGSQTYIDHSIISTNFKSSKIKSQVHADHFLNCSDHLSIELVIPALDRNQCEQNSKSISNDIARERFKDKQINALYTASLESETSTILSKIKVVNSNRGIVGRNIKSLIELKNSMSNAMIEVAGKYVPKKRYSKNKNPIGIKS